MILIKGSRCEKSSWIRGRGLSPQTLTHLHRCHLWVFITTTSNHVKVTQTFQLLPHPCTHHFQKSRSIVAFRPFLSYIIRNLMRIFLYCIEECVLYYNPSDPRASRLIYSFRDFFAVNLTKPFIVMIEFDILVSFNEDTLVTRDKVSEVLP